MSYMVCIMSILPKLQKEIEEYQEKLSAFSVRIEEISKRMKLLKRKGLEYGSITYAGPSKKYMRIVKPVTSGSKREFVYVGVCPVKQKKALESVERREEYVSLENELQRIEITLSASQVIFRTAISRLKY